MPPDPPVNSRLRHAHDLILLPDQLWTASAGPENLFIILFIFINGSLAGISDFGEDIVSEAGSDSGGISSHDGSENDTDSDYSTEPSSCSYTLLKR